MRSNPRAGTEGSGSLANGFTPDALERAAVTAPKLVRGGFPSLTAEHHTPGVPAPALSILPFLCSHWSGVPQGILRATGVSRGHQECHYLGPGQPRGGKGSWPPPGADHHGRWQKDIQGVLLAPMQTDVEPPRGSGGGALGKPPPHFGCTGQAQLVTLRPLPSGKAGASARLGPGYRADWQGASPLGRAADPAWSHPPRSERIGVRPVCLLGACSLSSL